MFCVNCFVCVLVCVVLFCVYVRFVCVSCAVFACGHVYKHVRLHFSVHCLAMPVVMDSCIC